MIAIKRIYKVSAGDTLWGIAKKYLACLSLYGNCASEWSKDRVPFRRAAFGIAYGIGGAHE